MGFDKEKPKPKYSYRRKNFIQKTIENLKIKFAFGERVNCDVYVQTGNVISHKVRDVLLKTKKENYWESGKLGFVIDGELPTNRIYLDEKNNPCIDVIYYNGTGRIDFLKVEDKEYKKHEILLLEKFEATITRIKGMFSKDKDKKLVFTFMVTGMGLMTLLFLFGFSGLAQFFNTLNQILAQNAGNNGIVDTVTNIVGGVTP